jgi:hypothetical protein
MIESFILEGLATVLIAVIAFFVLHDFPETASFLTVEERAWVVHRLKYQGSLGSGRAVAETEKFEWKYVRAAFTDWQIYVALFVSLNPSFHLLTIKTKIEKLDVLGSHLPSLRYHPLSPHNYQ